MIEVYVDLCADNLIMAGKKYFLHDFNQSNESGGRTARFVRYAVGVN